MGDAKEGFVMHRVLYIDSGEGIFGGGQISLLELLAHIDTTKFLPLVIVSEEGKLKKEVKKLGIECALLPMPRFKWLNPSPFFAGFWRIFNFVRKQKIKLIHSNTSRAALYAGPVAKILSIPLIWHVRVPPPDNLLDRFLVLFSSKIIAVSRIVKRRFVWLKKDIVETIYNGVDTRKFSPGLVQDDLRKKFHIDSKNIVIGTVGRLSPEKGLEYLISAIREVVNAYPRTKVLIVGDGDEKYRLSLQEKVKDLELSSHIILTGFYEDVPQILRCLDIFSLPSLFEGFNRSLLEAMACGLPVVATAVGGNVEIVQDGVNGLLVPPSNPGALAFAITELLKDKEKARKMGLEGKLLVEENFSIDINVRKIEKLYLHILE
ncbi:MAG: glycosyltransferase family 1 protein [Candidatus Stahlbacteria bacterium]|nr:MAG: glycosyltransferase family 1 protein [Candidatus Stahlbacteria bacterium]